MENLQHIIALVFLYIICFFDVRATRPIYEKLDHNCTDSVGKCIRANECDVPAEKLSDLIKCAWDDKMAIVCCPTINSFSDPENLTIQQKTVLGRSSSIKKSNLDFNPRNFLNHFSDKEITCKCIKAPDCPDAVTAIRKYPSHNLTHCGWDGFDEIVCCPLNIKVVPFLCPLSNGEIGVCVEKDSCHSDLKNEQNHKNPCNNENKDLVCCPGINKSLNDVFVKPLITKGNRNRKFHEACDKIQEFTSSLYRYSIQGGTDAESHEFPHMAALYYLDRDQNETVNKCAGSIIAERFILSAAHCTVSDKKNSPPIMVRIGANLLNSSEAQDIPIENITNYISEGDQADISIIRLAYGIKMSISVIPACLYPYNDDPVNGLSISGWGAISSATSEGTRNNLLKANVKSVPVDRCDNQYQQAYNGAYRVNSNQICAFGQGTDSCKGDSGGPLQIKNKTGAYFIVGIVAFGSECGGPLPTIYTRVSNYIDWIENIVWPS